MQSKLQEPRGKFDLQFWKFQNMMRTEPKSFIPFLEDLLARYEPGTKIYKTVRGTRMMSNEGKPAV